MKRLLVTIAWLALMVALQSHEFWLEAQKFRIKAGEELAVSFLVGENFTGESWDIGRHRVEKIILYEKSGTKDLKAIVPATKGMKLKVVLPNPGTKILAMQSNPAFIELTAKKFMEYLEADGLENVLDYRKKNGQDSSSGKENYTRYAKLIVQVGDALDDTWKKRAGHRFEMIPDANPGAIKSGDYMGCLVLYEGRPSAHTLVKVWGHVGNKIFLQNIYSENDGTIRFPISARGAWMVSAVRMEKSKMPEADWESSWASLVFNVE